MKSFGSFKTHSKKIEWYAEYFGLTIKEAVRDLKMFDDENHMRFSFCSFDNFKKYFIEKST